MARKPKNPPMFEDNDDPPKQAEFHFIEATKLGTLMKNIRSATRAKDEAVGEIRAYISAAVEKNNLDKQAFADYRRYEGLEDDQLKRRFAHFMHMMRASGLLEKALDKGEVEGAPASGNVHNIRRRAGVSGADLEDALA